MWLMEYFIHERFRFQRTPLSARLITEYYRFNWTVRDTLGLVFMSFYSFLISTPLVTRKYEEVLAIHVFQFTKF
jgi:hypothetical protein